MKINPHKIAKHQRLICSAAFNGMRDYLQEQGKECHITLNSGSLRIGIIEGDIEISYSMAVRFSNARMVE